MKYAQLQVYDQTATPYRVYASEEVLTAAVDEWKRFLDNIEGIGPRVLEVNGYCDTADRAACLFVFKMEDIRGMHLTRINYA